MRFKKLDTIAIKGPRIIVKDAMMMLDGDAATPEWPSIDAAPGVYGIYTCDDDGDFVAARIMMVGAKNPKRGKSLGQVSVDSGSIGFCDYDLLLSAAKADFDAYQDWTDDECESAVFGNSHGVVKFEEVSIAYLRAALGDGAFPVFELVSESQVVGMECHTGQIEN